MTTDLQERLSQRLHAEAAALVPDDRVPPLPSPAHRPGIWPAGNGSRWRAPVLAAAAVVAIAAATAIAVTAQRGGSATPATAPLGPTATVGAASGAPTTYPGHSPILDRPAPGFDCAGGPTTSAANAGGVVIGIRPGMFCVASDMGGTSHIGGTEMRDSGALRATLVTDSSISGVVDGSVDGLTWTPADGDESAGTPLDLYDLGTLRGFAHPVGLAGGTLTLYSGSTVLLRHQVPGIGAGFAAASSSPAPGAPPAPADISNPGAGSGVTSAQPSYPPGQGPTPKPGAWPTNARGLTYGSDAHANAETGEPDLIAAYATNGRIGYVYRTDVDGPMPTSLAQAQAQNSAPDRTIPVYESDGVTQIGVFVIGGGTVVVDTGTGTVSPTR